MEISSEEALATLQSINADIAAKNSGRWIGDFPECYLQSRLADHFAESSECTFKLEVAPRELNSNWLKMHEESGGQSNLNDRSRIDIVLSVGEMIVPVEVKTVWGETTWRTDLDRLIDLIVSNPSITYALFVGYQQQRGGISSIAANINLLQQQVAAAKAHALERNIRCTEAFGTPTVYEGSNEMWAKQTWTHHMATVCFQQDD